MDKKMLFVFSTPPYDHWRSQEGLDALLATAAFDQDVRTLFIGDGVYQWMADPQATTKNIAKILASFEHYDLNPVYVQSTALDIRKVPQAALPKDAILLSDSEIALQLSSADHIFYF
jgi:tRNA 2-thiouridine synthesizing protein C